MNLLEDPLRDEHKSASAQREHLGPAFLETFVSLGSLANASRVRGYRGMYDDSHGRESKY